MILLILHSFTIADVILVLVLLCCKRRAVFIRQDSAASDSEEKLLHRETGEDVTGESPLLAVSTNNNNNDNDSELNNSGDATLSTAENDQVSYSQFSSPRCATFVSNNQALSRLSMKRKASPRCETVITNWTVIETDRRSLLKI